MATQHQRCGGFVLDIGTHNEVPNAERRTCNNVASLGRCAFVASSCASCLCLFITFTSADVAPSKYSTTSRWPLLYPRKHPLAVEWRMVSPFCATAMSATTRGDSQGALGRLSFDVHRWCCSHEPHSRPSTGTRLASQIEQPHAAESHLAVDTVGIACMSLVQHEDWQLH